MMCCKCMLPVLCRVRFVVASSTLAFCYHTYTCIYTQWDIVFNFYPFTETMVMIKEYLVLNVLHCQPFYSFHTKFSLYYYYHYIRYLKKKRTCISSSLLGQMKSVLGHWKSKLGVVYFYKKSFFLYSMNRILLMVYHVYLTTINRPTDSCDLLLIES